MAKSLKRKRLEFLVKGLGSQTDLSYAESFDNKILRKFRATGLIPKNKYDCVSICVMPKEIKNAGLDLRKLGIKFRKFRIEHCYELVLYKRDYNYFQLGSVPNWFNKSEEVFDFDEFYSSYLREFDGQEKKIKTIR